MIKWNCPIQFWFQNFGKVKGNPIQSFRRLRVVWRSEMWKETRRPIWSWTTDQRGLCVPSASWKCQGNNNNSISMKILFPLFQNRGAAHRVAAYKIWQSLGCYTLTLDYRCVKYNQKNKMHILSRQTDQSEDRRGTFWPIRSQTQFDEEMIIRIHDDWPARKRNVKIRKYKKTICWMTLWPDLEIF